MELAEKAVLSIRKDLEDRAVLNRLWQAKNNGAWLTAITHSIKGTELSWEEFRYNIPL